MRDLKIGETTKPKHRFFGESRFSYFARNGTFLDLVGLHKYPLSKVVLLGSGPIEPFEVAALPRFRDASIIAVDCDQSVNELIGTGLETGRLDVKSLARVCRSTDAENDYLSDVTRMFRQLNQVRHQGWQLSWEDPEDAGTILINQQLKGRLRTVLCDLKKEVPAQVLQADLIFEGFMLVNWAKNAGTDALSELFLKRLAGRMSPRTWFASTTSVTHYLGYAGSKPFLRQALAAGLFPATGVMMRWSVADNQNITSQFGTVLRVSETLDPSLRKLGEVFENDTLHWISTFGVQHTFKTVDVDSLATLLEKGDVLSFRALDRQTFKVLLASWSDLSRKCQFERRPYELTLDYEIQSA